MSYIYDNLINGLQNAIEEYYRCILIKDEKAISASVYSYIDTDVDNRETITSSDKTKQLRDLNIDKVMEIDTDISKFDEKIAEIENMRVKEEGQDDFGQISVVVKQKVLTKFQLNLNIGSFDDNQLHFLFNTITNDINKRILELIKGIDIIDVDSERVLYNTEYLLRASKFRGAEERFGTGYYIENKADFNINKLNIGGNEKYLMISKQKPIVFFMDNIMCIQNPYNPTDYKNSYTIRIDGFLDIISEIDECKIINLTDEFFNSLS
jgi:hypothetical protein